MPAANKNVHSVRVLQALRAEQGQVAAAIYETNHSSQIRGGKTRARFSVAATAC
jgi:hypothetical protein